MQYTKEMQIGKRYKPKRRERTKVKKEDYQKMIEYWGAFCIYCGSPRIEAHHVKFRSALGGSRWRNLLPLCKTHHMKVHQDNTIRRSLELKLEHEFGSDFWKDEWHLYDEGKIDHPTVGEYERYFREIER